MVVWYDLQENLYDCLFIFTIDPSKKLSISALNANHFKELLLTSDIFERGVFWQLSF
jgi:hypothetical protein